MIYLRRLLMFFLMLIADSTFAAKPPALADIIITEQQALVFPAQVSGFDATITITPDDPNAVVFTATGEPNAIVVAVIVENNFDMNNSAASGQPSKIVVDTWTWGGSLDVNGVATFDGSGNLNNLRLGGSAHVLAEDTAGDFVDAPIFRLVYQ